MEKIKAEILVPTVQYGNIRFFVEGTGEEIIYESERLNRIYIGGFGLEQAEWNNALDRYLRDGSMDADIHEKMSKEQRWLIHEIDKSTSRLNYKNPKGND